MASQSKAMMTPSPKTAPGSTISKNATVRATPGKNADGDRKEQAPRTAVTTPVGTVDSQFQGITLSDASFPSGMEALKAAAKGASSTPSQTVSPKKAWVPSIMKGQAHHVGEDVLHKKDRFEAPKTPTSAPPKIDFAADTTSLDLEGSRLDGSVSGYHYPQICRYGDGCDWLTKRGTCRWWHDPEEILALAPQGTVHVNGWMAEPDRSENVPEGFIEGFHNYYQKDCEYGKACCWLDGGTCLFRHKAEDILELAPPGTVHVNGWLAPKNSNKGNQGHDEGSA